MKKRFFLCFTAIFVFCFMFAGSALAVTQQRIVIPYATQNNNWWTGLAVHNETEDTMYCYISIYDEDGALIGGDCFTVDPKALFVDVLDNFISESVQGRVSVYVQTNVAGGWTAPFSLTMFMGNDTGFGMQTFQSQDYEAIGLILCDIMFPIPLL